MYSRLNIEHEYLLFKSYKEQFLFETFSPRMLISRDFGNKLGLEGWKHPWKEKHKLGRSGEMDILCLDLKRWNLCVGSFPLSLLIFFPSRLSFFFFLLVCNREICVLGLPLFLSPTLTFFYLFILLFVCFTYSFLLVAFFFFSRSLYYVIFLLFYTENRKTEGRKKYKNERERNIREGKIMKTWREEAGPSTITGR